LVTRGFRIPESYGLNEYEVAEYLKVMGCVNALMLDGGGSSEWVSMYEGTNELKVRNNPSDGYERNVSSSLILVSTAARDGEFDHAAIMPTTEVYTPGSTVTFTATGVDSAGGTASIPQGATWALADNSYGEINSQGIFVSNGKIGDVTVQLRYDNTVVGKSTIMIAAPDSITFVSPEVSIGRGKESDLGILVQYQGRQINYKGGDLIWNLSNPEMGTVNTETNTFTASPDLTTSGTITVKSRFDESISGSIVVQVGQDPTVVMDFEDYINEDGTVTDAYTYWGADENGRIVGRESYGTYLVQPKGKLTTLFYNKGGNESAEIVNRADGYPVHLGTYSLKINYDMSKVSSGATEGANVGLTQNYIIPGNPTGIGLWVYVPKNTPNLWLRVRLSTIDSTGKVTGTTQYDFTKECKMAFEEKGTYGGLSDVEQGSWQFLTADLSKYAGQRFMIPAGESIRIMYKLDTSSGNLTSPYNSRTDVKNSYGIYLPDGSTITQADCIGSIYVDDFMFIYGSVNQDAKAPTITSFTANDEDISDGMTFDTDSINFKATFDDEYDDFNKVKASGIDFDNVYIYVDGQRMQKAVVDKNGFIELDGVKLANGEHSVKLLVCDKNGNEKNITYRFVVDCTSSTATTVQLVSRQQEALLGKTIDLDVKSSNVSDVSSMTMVLQIDSKYQDKYTITAGEGYSIDEDSIEYDKIHNTVKFTANRNGDAESTGSGTIATISFAIPTTLAKGSYFVYSVDAGSLTYASGYSEGNEPSFASLNCKLPVTAPYTISSDIIVAGMSDSSFYVKDSNGDAVAGVTVYLNSSTIGITDSNGKLAVPASIYSEVNAFTIYAKDSQGNVSFSYSGQSYAVGGAIDSGRPIHIMNNAALNGSTMRNLSWISNPKYSQAIAKVQISDSEASINNGTIYDGISKLFAFTGSTNISENYAARINGVTIDGLTPGATYYYRVGDGVTWSEVDSFTMPSEDNDTNIFILGDIQANDETNIKTILNMLQNDGTSYDLGIQTGDAVDLASSYSYWTEALELMDMFKNNQTMLHVIGNHEETGESGEEITSAVYNLQNPSYYSVDYGLVYVATIKFMDSMNAYEEALKWLVEDAEKSNAPYKILVMHQPAYYTNDSDPSNALLHELLPAYAEQAGIDIVFSGHDHSYARTEEINGVVYYICGTSGEKAYPITIHDDFHFVQATDDFTAIYITLNATNDELTVTTYDLVNGEPQIIDTYTKSN
jgi:3',5'-cyclic AMP phosphodiesterase CpdA